MALPYMQHFSVFVTTQYIKGHLIATVETVLQLYQESAVPSMNMFKWYDLKIIEYSMDDK